MTAPSIVGVETALIAVLSEISGLNVASYMGQIDEAGQGDASAFPAAWPLFQGERLEFIDGPVYRRIQDWVVIVAAQSYGGDDSPHTRAQTGAYALIESVLAKVANWKSSALSGIESTRPQSVSRVRVSRTEAYYSIAFELAYDQTFTYQGETMASGTLGGYKISATQANTTTTFETSNGPTTGITIYNAGASAVFVAVNAVATTSSVEIPAGSTIHLDEFSATSLGCICDTGLTATVYLYVTYR